MEIREAMIYDLHSRYGWFRWDSWEELKDKIENDIILTECTLDYKEKNVKKLKIEFYKLDQKKRIRTRAYQEKVDHAYINYVYAEELLIDSKYRLEIMKKDVKVIEELIAENSPTYMY